MKIHEKISLLEDALGFRIAFTELLYVVCTVHNRWISCVIDTAHINNDIFTDSNYS
jgi:hypothetical protein